MSGTLFWGAVRTSRGRAFPSLRGGSGGRERCGHFVSAESRVTAAGSARKTEPGAMGTQQRRERGAVSSRCGTLPPPRGEWDRKSLCWACRDVTVTHAGRGVAGATGRRARGGRRRRRRCTAARRGRCAPGAGALRAAPLAAPGARGRGLVTRPAPIGRGRPPSRSSLPSPEGRAGRRRQMRARRTRCEWPRASLLPPWSRAPVPPLPRHVPRRSPCPSCPVPLAWEPPGKPGRGPGGERPRRAGGVPALRLLHL